jgi:hypothetical protein
MGQLASSSFSPGDVITIPFTLTGTMSPDNLNKAANQVIAQLSDANGNFTPPTELGRVTTNNSGSITAQIPNVPSGSGYRIRLVSTNYPMVGGNIQTVSIAPNSYTVTVAANPSNAGTVTGGGTYNQGQSCTVSATANTGYTFTNWTENGNVVSSNATYTFNVEGNRNLVANFTENTYTITVSANPSNGGTATGGGTFTYGQSCTVTATANTGYSFVNWTENGEVVTTNASYTFIVTGNRTLVANFTLNSYTITVTADPTEGGMVTGAGNYDYGASCTLTATANENYEFINWTKNDVVVSTDVTYTFEVAASEDYVAHFRYFDSVDEDTAVCQIFPNPFTSTLSITTEKTIKTVRVYDAYGHLLMEKAVSDNHFVFDLSGLSPGSYIMHVDYGDNRSIHRIMKAQ